MAKETKISTNAETVKIAIDKYLAASTIALTFEQLVPLYVDNKLGFSKLAAEYKKANPDEDAKDIDDVVKVERDNTIKEFSEGFSKDELKKKFDDFKLSASEAQTAMSGVVKEFSKVIAESAMPNVVGPVAPNPFSIALKLFNGIARVKKLVDRTVISMRIFMTAAEALGLDKTDEYEKLMGIVAGPLKAIQSTIAKKEAESTEDLELAQALEDAKKGYTALTRDGQKQNGIDIEKVIAEEFSIYEWPLNFKSKKQIAGAVVFTGRQSLRNFRAKLAIDYDDWLNFTIKQLLESNNSTDSKPNITTNTPPVQPPGRPRGL